ncbi:MAG: hypothetical protein AVDCRST_MAG93-4285 [uncultured Chloroflexia bacterium]|uniref:Uncharacterized protein n=1 Tax=uncultured Chloroflexia bacterium TaxID=1672391 RepID=A0A6J4K5Q0_9CHLR|nr:MAG: hypothetical protein AVDCRST_MAG93-4285 [uncultured Chloroflexia bacterium]
MLITLHIPVRPLLWLGIAGLVLVLVWPQHALGRVESCRRDPIAFLSNGQQIMMTAVIGTEPENVQNITYILRVPKGLTMSRVVYQGNSAVKASEDVRFFADQPPGSFTIATVVKTTVKDVSVQATTRIRQLVGSVSGLSHQQLTVTLQTAGTIPSPSATAVPSATPASVPTMTPMFESTPTTMPTLEPTPTIESVAVTTP